MDTETPAAPASRRPRTLLLVLLGIVLAAAAVLTLRDSAVPQAPTSNRGRTQPQTAADKDKIDPAQLDVEIEKLAGTMPSPDDTERNPFRFQPKAPPPPLPRAPRDPDKELQPLPPVATGPPPIPLKFIGVTEAPGIGKIAALSDCRHTVQGIEGQEIEGRYRIVKIGVESLVIEYLDGSGRTTLRMSGQECVGK